MNKNDLRARIHLRQGARNRLLARVSPLDHACGAAQLGFCNLVLDSNEIATCRDEKLGDLSTGGQAAQRKNQQRHAIEFQKLLGQIRTHARSQTGSRNDGGNLAHAG